PPDSHADRPPCSTAVHSCLSFRSLMRRVRRRLVIKRPACRRTSVSLRRSTPAPSKTKKGPSVTGLFRSGCELSRKLNQQLVQTLYVGCRIFEAVPGRKRGLIKQDV